jgi:hypothetical protein
MPLNKELENVVRQLYIESVTELKKDGVDDNHQPECPGTLQ